MWKTIEGFEKYEVSDAGQVRRISTGLILATHSWDGRYLRVALYATPGKCETRAVHRLVAHAFHGPSELEVNHKDGNRKNNSAGNLEYVTGSENMKHAHQIGLQCNQGERHSQHKLKESDIVEIRTLVADGHKQASIARMYGVDQSCVSKIAARKAWPHITFNLGAAAVNAGCAA